MGRGAGGAGKGDARRGDESWVDGVGVEEAWAEVASDLLGVGIGEGDGKAVNMLGVGLGGRGGCQSPRGQEGGRMAGVRGPALFPPKQMT